MSQYEKRLQEDLTQLREGVRAVAGQVEEQLRNAVHALLTDNRALAYLTALGDLPINRAIRRLDRSCHAFVARHLPSAGHLRFVSSVMRLSIEIERIGDYAVSISREAVQLGTRPPTSIFRDVELLAAQGQRMLHQAVATFLEGNAEQARATMGMAEQLDATFDKIYGDLLLEGREKGIPLRDMLALFVIFTRLKRVGEQSKNICEETVFAATGQTKAPKVYRILFLDARDDLATQMAAAYARRAFPNSGRYASAGWQPAAQVDPRLLQFLSAQGHDMTGSRPRQLEPTHEGLGQYHVIVSLGGDMRPHIPQVPFKTAVLEWSLGPGLEGLPPQEAQNRLEELYKDVASRVRELMELMRGDGAD